MATALHQPNSIAHGDSNSDAVGSSDSKISPNADLLLRVSTSVQTTLDLNHLLELFYKQVNAILSVSGIVYSNEVKNLNLTIGTLGEHSCDYNLVTHKDLVGDLQFTRDKDFTKTELEHIELLLSAFVQFEMLCFTETPLKRLSRIH